MAEQGEWCRGLSALGIDCKEVHCLGWRIEKNKNKTKQKSASFFLEPGNSNPIGDGALFLTRQPPGPALPPLWHVTTYLP